MLISTDADAPFDFAREQAQLDYSKIILTLTGNGADEAQLNFSKVIWRLTGDGADDSLFLPAVQDDGLLLPAVPTDYGLFL